MVKEFRWLSTILFLMKDMILFRVEKHLPGLSAVISIAVKFFNEHIMSKFVCMRQLFRKNAIMEEILETCKNLPSIQNHEFGFHFVSLKEMVKSDCILSIRFWKIL
jgi:hypothetical protein